MTQKTRFKAPISIGALSLILAFSLLGCKAPTESGKTLPAAAAQKADARTQTLPPLRKALACLPENATIIAAHRGTDKRWTELAENSIAGLNALIKHGTLMAEIDVKLMWRD